MKVVSVGFEIKLVFAIQILIQSKVFRRVGKQFNTNGSSLGQFLFGKIWVTF